MERIFICHYLTSKYSDDIASTCSVLDANGNENYEPRIYEYLAISISSDIYLPDVIQQHFNIISQAEQNPGEVYGAGGQNFSLDISAKEVVFYHNMFEEDEGWPVLSCSLPMFKSVLTAWHLFLQLPKGIHTKLEVEIPYQP